MKSTLMDNTFLGHRHAHNWLAREKDNGQVEETKVIILGATYEHSCCPGRVLQKRLSLSYSLPPPSAVTCEPDVFERRRIGNVFREEFQAFPSMQPGKRSHNTF